MWNLAPLFHITWPSGTRMAQCFLLFGASRSTNVEPTSTLVSYLWGLVTSNSTNVDPSTIGLYHLDYLSFASRLRYESSWPLFGDSCSTNVDLTITYLWD